MFCFILTFEDLTDNEAVRRLCSLICSVAVGRSLPYICVDLISNDVEILFYFALPGYLYIFSFEYVSLT